MGKWKTTDEACPCGKSSDAYAEDFNGEGYCFSCGKYFQNEDLMEEETEDVTKLPEEPQGETTYDYVSLRGISRRTMEFFGVMSKLKDGIPYSTAFIYPNNSMKIRVLPKKPMYTVGPIGGEHLFGKNLFDPGSKDTITIVEGEFDALAVYEMIDGRGAVVSVKSGATAFGDVLAEREYINSFKKIILCLDNDKVGIEATKQITRSGIFDYEKLYKTNHLKYKDANDYLEKGDANEFFKLWQSAKRFTPDAIINSFEDIRTALAKKQDAPIGTYPFSELSDCLYGIHRGEFILLKGLEGIGKTEVCRALVYQTLVETDIKIATIFLEENEATTIKGVATYELGYPCNLQSASVSDEDIWKGYAKALKGDETRLYIHTHFASEEEEEIIDNIRFLVTVAGCGLVLLDNLTMLTTGREGEDERLRIDRLIRRLRDLVNELNFCLVLVAHVNDTGQTRGSRLPDKLANTVIYMERDIKAAGVSERNLTKFMVEKARLQGSRTGPAGAAFFDPVSFTLRDLIPEDTISMPNIN